MHPHLDDKNMPLLIFVNKGIEVGTHALTLEIIVDTCGPEVARAATFIVRSSAVEYILCPDLILVWALLRERKYAIDIDI